MKFVVVHHALHQDEGVYRLVYAEAVEHEVHIYEPNPDFDAALLNNPDHDPDQGIDPDYSYDVPQQIHKVETVTTLANHQDIVWDMEDERWLDRKPADIAADQRKLARQALKQRQKEAKQMAAKLAATQELGGIGEEL